MPPLCPPSFAHALALVVSTGALAVGSAGCGLQAGTRFGAAGAEPDRLRVHVLDTAQELDPARARTPIEQAVARQLFSALVETTADGGVVPALASSWRTEGEPEHPRLVITLRSDAAFSDGTPMFAHDVVWSWRRALRPSTGAADLRALAVIGQGEALAKGALLRVGREGLRGRAPPFSIFRAGPADPVHDDELPMGTPVRVLDTNARIPCCGVPVPLLRSPDAGAAAVGALLPGERGLVVGQREIVTAQGARVLLQIRGPSGDAGWAPRDQLAIHIPTVGLVPVIARGQPPVLRTAPEGSGDRGALAEDDLVEVIERGASHSLVVDMASGRAGWLDNANLDDTVRERAWFLVAATDGARGWVSEHDLVFDPSQLEAHVVDDRTLAFAVVGDVDVALRALSEPALRPVPARVVEEHGRVWTAPRHFVGSGPYMLVDGSFPEGVRVLARVPDAAEAARAHVDRVVLVQLDNRTTALHLYRAGRLDALLDGALPGPLAGTLSRASDFVAGPRGGALVAPEVRGWLTGRLELRDVRVVLR